MTSASNVGSFSWMMFQTVRFAMLSYSWRDGYSIIVFEPALPL